MKQKLTPLEYKWICYDIGNSAFILLVSTILPIYFNSLSSAAGLAENDYLSYWSYATSISTIIVALLGPILGTIADYKGKKKRIFATSAFLGALSLACFWIPSYWLSFLVLYIVAKICYSLSLVFYDSMLVDVTKEENMDAISTQGYAWGYIGSCIPFIISLVFVLMNEAIGISMHTAMMITFILNALWWVLFTLPLFRSYRQKHYIEPEKHVIHDTFARLKKTLTSIKKQKKDLFVLAFILLLY